MRALTRWRRLHLQAGVTLVLLAGWLAAPASARASCGDYVHIGQTGAHKAERPDGAMPAAPAKHKLPCTGPHCSRAPVSDPPLSTSQGPPRIEQWANASGLLPGDSPAPAPALWDSGARPPVTMPSPIFHPPRLHA